jgi:hypothetical protein
MQNTSKNQDVWPPAVNHTLPQAGPVPQKFSLQGILSLLLSLLGVLLLVIESLYNCEISALTRPYGLPQS